MKRSATNPRGSMLVDVVIATSILSIALVALLALVASLSTRRQIVDRRQHAALVCANLLERYAARPGEPGQTALPLDEATLRLLPKATATLTRTLEPLDDDRSDSPAWHKLTLEIQWIGAGRMAERCRLLTWVVPKRGQAP